MLRLPSWRRGMEAEPMQMSSTQKKAVDHYYQELAAYQEKNVTHETAVRSAFQNLMALPQME